MKNSKTIQEQIDALAIEAKALYTVCQKEGREFIEEEESRFNEITNKLVPGLQDELKKAKAREEEIVKLSKQEAQRTSVENLSKILDAPSQPHVLPVNGQFDNHAELPLQCHRMSRLKAFKNERDAYNSGMWLRAIVAAEKGRTDQKAVAHCRRLGWDVEAAATEGTGSAGGFLVPAPLAAALIDVRERVGIMRQLLNVMPMTSDTLTINRRASGLTVYYGTENPSSDMTSSDKGWEQIELLARKRYVVHQLSAELVDDALIAVVDDAVQEMGYALALKEDDEAVNGDGTSSYGGILGLKNGIGAGGVYTAPTNDDTWAELAIDDFTGTMGKLPEQYMQNPAWLCSSAFYHTVMLRVQAEAGGNTVMNIQQGDNGQRMFLGYPVYLTNRCTTASAASTIHAYFGSFNQAIILGERTGIRVARSDEFAFLRDLTTLKATTRYDMKFHAPGTASAAGGVVALKTAA